MDDRDGEAAIGKGRERERDGKRGGERKGEVIRTM